MINQQAFSHLFRNYATKTRTVINRNPRNLEQMTIGHKPSGWMLEKPGRSFWNKIVLEVGKRNLTASIKHYTGSVPVTASTKEWAIRKHLYSSLDISAYSNLGRILGRRCLETGISEVYCDLPIKKGGKVEAFVKELENSGISLQEPPQYEHPKPSDLKRPVRPWELE